MLKEDNRKTGLKNGLRQLTKKQLQRVLGYNKEFCLDTYNYDEKDKTWCPLAIALELDTIIKKPTAERVYNELVDRGYKVYNTKGIQGKFYTDNRAKDLIIAAKEVLKEKKEN